MPSVRGGPSSASLAWIAPVFEVVGLAKKVAIFAQVSPALFCFLFSLLEIGFMSFAKLSLKGRALKLLSQREHSRLELLRKLAEHVEEGDDLGAVLDELEKRGFISEERVVESVIHSKAGRYGSARLLQELRSKGLDDEIVRNVGEQLRDTELQRAQEIWRKRFGEPPADIKEKAKQLRFLASRGFSGAVASRVLRDAPYSGTDESDISD